LPPVPTRSVRGSQRKREREREREKRERERERGDLLVGEEFEL